MSRNLTDERTIGRLLTLTDGIFAIAILFLLIDIKVPEDIDTIGIASALFSLGILYQFCRNRFVLVSPCKIIPRNYQVRLDAGRF